jgi:hypothetical protein
MKVDLKYLQISHKCPKFRAQIYKKVIYRSKRKILGKSPRKKQHKHTKIIEAGRSPWLGIFHGQRGQRKKEKENIKMFGDRAAWNVCW